MAMRRSRHADQQSACVGAPSFAGLTAHGSRAAEAAPALDF